ncbi:MAG TPA: hypothetical protein O0X42_00740 [Methanocorpusculum sp.]|nr:hypothetical protein [Methanocorpusculum sp.]
MDENAKTEARNYLAAAGFFVIAACFLPSILRNIGSSSFIEFNPAFNIALGLSLISIATLLIVLRKRDMTALLFFMLGSLELFWAFTLPGMWDLILTGFLFFAALITLVSKENVKRLVFLIPLILFVREIMCNCFEYNVAVNSVLNIILTVISLYFAFACASERISLPGRKLFTADETTDFKASGSVLGYMLFALLSGGYALYYILGEAVLPLETFVSIELLCSALMIFIAVLLLAVGRMRFTPVMFLLIGLTNILVMYSTGTMFIGTGILMIIIGLFAMLRKESRILPGIMLIVYGCTDFFTAFAGGNAPVVSVILNAIPCLIAIYLAFVVYSQRKLPKF